MQTPNAAHMAVMIHNGTGLATRATGSTRKASPDRRPLIAL